MAGRRPKPTALKKLRNNPGKRALNRNEPKPEAAIPSCPKHLDKEARAEWLRATTALLKLNLLADVYRPALAAYCTAWSRWLKAERGLRKRGLVIGTRTGYPVQNPYLGIANTAMEAMRRFLIEFGMTPSSITRVHGAGTSDDDSPDPWDQLDMPSSPNPAKSLKVQ
jgi:P27 family predicted phage terminase small subunit